MSVDVCVCTFRRPSLATTLESLDTQKLPGHQHRIIVIDNDETPSAQAHVEELSAQMQTPVLYIHAPARNISIARNAGLDAATADFVAFIDDDESAPEDWLAKMLEVAETDQLDIVFGPTVGQYKSEDPAWIRNKNYHTFMPYRRAGQVETGSSGNAFIRYSAPVFEGERFLVEKGRTGGEDTEFFNRIRMKGARVGMTDKAPVFEPVDENRLSFSWIAKRKMRSGISYGRHIMLREGMTSRFRALISALAKILFSLAAAIVSVFSQTQRNFWLLRSVFHVGVLQAALGQKEKELY